jgi:hypothetical protein
LFRTSGADIEWCVFIPAFHTGLHYFAPPELFLETNNRFARGAEDTEEGQREKAPEILNFEF